MAGMPQWVSHPAPWKGHHTTVTGSTKHILTLFNLRQTAVHQNSCGYSRRGVVSLLSMLWLCVACTWHNNGQVAALCTCMVCVGASLLWMSIALISNASQTAEDDIIILCV